ncbi:MAG: arginine--tRNA ligase [Bacteroidota bacterium]
MSITAIIQEGVAKAVNVLYDHDIASSGVTLSATRKEFTGDFTVVVFPFTKVARKKPEAIGDELGNYLLKEVEAIVDFNVVKGFLNLVIADDFWLNVLQEVDQDDNYGQFPQNGKKVMVEFSSPNTNKPLHLGHIRNILLGWSCSKILAAAGYEVIRVQIVNDRGIAICKSMLAWKLYGNGETPESSGKKGDHLIGEYYILFETKFKAEYAAWQNSATGQAIYAEKRKEEQSAEAFFKTYKNTYFNEYSDLGKKAKEMLLAWESGDAATTELWKKMNNWVYDGFNETYQALEVEFDKLYFESNTYLLGKDTIAKGLEEGTFYQKEDQSIWIDLEEAKLDHKLVLRSDGTAVYMTQDIGTAQLRYDEFGMDKMVYVVGNEQDYHFQVLFEILKRLKMPYADDLFHLSYGMVDLPTGKMKSREGTVVDADDLVKEVLVEARNKVEENGGITDLSEEHLQTIYRKTGLAALKFFILKVNPKKRMVFNPTESVDFQGHTGPYIQYNYVRINGVINKGKQMEMDWSVSSNYLKLEQQEKELILQIREYPELVLQAAASYDPSIIANYCYSLAKQYSKFWNDLSIFNADTEAAKAFRLKLSAVVGKVLAAGMQLIGIEMPERM